MDPGPYIDTCLYLYCSLSTSERDVAVCDTLAGYVRECAQQHVIINWRKTGFCGTLSFFGFIQNKDALLKLWHAKLECQVVRKIHYYFVLRLIITVVLAHRAHVSQRSGVFRLRVLVSPQLLVSSPPHAGSVQGRVCRWVWVSSGSLPTRRSVLETRRLSVLLQTPHVRHRRLHHSEVQHMVGKHDWS